MADVLVRLDVQSEAYESKLKNATANLQHMEKEVRRTGATFAYADKAELEFVRSLGQMSTQATSSMQKLREYSNAIMSLTETYRAMTAEEKNSDFGKAMAASIDELKAKAANLKDIMADTQGEIKRLSSDTGVFDQVAGGITAVTSAFQVGQGAMQAFGVKSGDAMQAMAQLQGVMAVTNGLTKIQAALQKESAMMIGLTNVQKKAAAAAEALDTAAKGKNIAVTKAATVAQKALNAVANANPFVLLAAAVGAAAGAFALFRSKADETDQSVKQFRDSVSSTMAGLMTTYTMLQNEWKNLSTEQEKNDWISNNADKFNELGVSIESVADAENVFERNTEAMIKSFELRAKAAALQSLAEEKYKEYYSKRDMADKFGLGEVKAGDEVRFTQDQAGQVSREDYERKDGRLVYTKEGAERVNSRRFYAEEKNQANELLREYAKLKKEQEGVFSFAGIKKAYDKGNNIDSKKAQIEELASAQVAALDRMSMSEEEYAQKVYEIEKDKNEKIAALYIEGSKERSQANKTLSDLEAKRKGELAKQELDTIKAEIEAEASMRMAALDKQSMSEEQYAQKSYQIEKDKLNKILLWTKEGTKERAQVNKQIADLETRHNAEVAKNTVELKKAQYEEEASAQLAALSTQKMTDEEFAQKEYEIEKDKLQKTAALYAEGSTERLQISKQISDLETKNNRSTAKDEVSITKAKYEEEAATQISELDRQAMTEQEYENEVYEIKKANLQRIAELYQEGTAERAAANTAIENLEIQHQGNLVKIAKDAQKKQDSGILSSMIGKAKQVGWNSENLGVSGFKEKINLGVDISDEEWNAVLDKLNERLQSFGMDPVQINFETGNLEQVFDEAKVQFEKFMSDMNSGVSAISTIGNAFNDLKGIGEDLASAFSGEMDAWDSLMTVFNSGISIMQTVMGVMEAINTLQQLSGALSDQKKEKQLEETTTVVAGKMAESTANMQEAGTSMTAAGANAAESSSAAGKSVAGIPIVGPILAVAAIAAVLAATFAAMSKAKSAGSFATGGIIPGNSFSGDNQIASVNAGELILSRSQQANIAGQLQSNPMGNLRLSTEISGSNLRVVLNNDNRSRGGSRDVYGVR